MSEILTIIPFQLITSVCHSIDLALDLLKHEPEFITRLDFDGVSPPVVLATLSYVFPSGNQLVFWKRWIYNGGNYVLSYFPINCSAILCTPWMDLIFDKITCSTTQ